MLKKSIRKVLSFKLKKVNVWINRGWQESTNKRKISFFNKL